MAVSSGTNYPASNGVSGTSYPAWLSTFQASLGQAILHGCHASLGQPILNGCELFNHLCDSPPSVAVCEILVSYLHVRHMVYGASSFAVLAELKVD